MTGFQQIVKYLSIALAIFLAASIIIGGISVLGAIFGRGHNNILDELYEVEISQDIEKIEIDISAASLEIVSGNKFSLSTNIDKLEVSSNNSKLYVKQNQKHVYVNTGKSGKIIITVPENINLKAFDLDAGAGAVYIECLNTQNADMDMGAGALTVRRGEIGNLELDLGVGETNLTSALKGRSSINCGVGETNINIIGQKSDYSIDIDTGVGLVTFENMHIKGNTVIGDGQYKLDIDGGVGSININFVNE